MKDNITKVRLTMHIPFAKPNKSGTVFTKEAVEAAVGSAPAYIPIVYTDGNGGFDKCIGTTADGLHIVAWDSENQLCEVIADGVVFRCGANIEVNRIENGVISDFRIMSIGLIQASK